MTKQRFPTTDEISSVANGRWLDILESLTDGLGPAIKNLGRHVTCPLPHKGSSDFRLCKNKGSELGLSFCTCGTRNGFQLLQELNDWTFLEAKDAVADHLGLISSSPEERERKVEIARLNSQKLRAIRDAENAKRDITLKSFLNELWMKSVPLDHPSATAGRRYFHMRKIAPTALSSHIRFCENVRLRTEGMPDIYTPAIISRVYDNFGTPLTVHLTHITPQGYKVSEVKSKRLMPIPSNHENGNGLAIPVMNLSGSSIMGIAEGIETAASAGLIHNLPVWAAISAGPLRNFVPPPSINHLICYADLDANGTGAEAAQKLGENLAASGWKGRYTINLPPVYLFKQGMKGMDWADVWYNHATPLPYAI